MEFEALDNEEGYDPVDLITDDCNDADYILDQIKADDENESKADDDMLEETVPLFSDDD